METTDIFAFEDDSNDGSTTHEIAEPCEEGLSLQVCVVLLDMLLRRVQHLQSHDLVATTFESGG